MDRFHPPIFVTSSHEDVDLASSPTVNTSPEKPATSINISRPAFPSISQPRHVKMRITTDVHFDPAASEMTAVFEVPGLKKRDLSIHMCLCPYSRVRQIIITGRLFPPFCRIPLALPLKKNLYKESVLGQPRRNARQGEKVLCSAPGPKSCPGRPRGYTSSEANGLQTHNCHCEAHRRKATDGSLVERVFPWYRGFHMLGLDTTLTLHFREI